MAQLAHTSALIWAVFLAMGLLVWALAVLSWRGRATVPGAGWLSVMLVAVGQILLFYGASFAGGLSLEARLTAIDLTYAGWIVGPVALLVYVARLTQLDGWLTRVTGTILFLGTAAAAWLIFGPTAQDTFFNGGRDPATFDFTASIYYWAFVLWAYLLVITALVLTAVAASRSARLRRSQVWLLYVTLALPVVLSVFGAQNYKVGDVDPTVLSLLIIAFTAYATSHFPFFDLRPLTEAEQQLSSHRGVVVIDSKGRLAQVNARAAQLLGLHDSVVVGLEVEMVWPTEPEIVAGLRGADMVGISAQSADSGERLVFQRSPIIEPSGERSGTLVLIEPVAREVPTDA